MDVALKIFDQYGIQALGWAVAIFLAWKFISRWDVNITKLTDNVIELSAMVKVHQSELESEKKRNDNQDGEIKAIKRKVFKVIYED